MEGAMFGLRLSHYPGRWKRFGFGVPGYWMLLLLLLLHLLLLRESHHVFGAEDKEELVGALGSSVLLDPKIRVDLNKSEILWIFVASHRSSLTILHHIPHSAKWAEPSEQFRSRLQFNLSNGSLIVNRLEAADEGVYSFTVGDQELNIIQLILFEKLVEAVILSNSTSHSSGSTVQLICNVSGDPHQYQWQKDGGEISQPYQLTDGNRTLVIVKASRRDCGMYTCVATNPVSSIQTDYTLTILEKLVEAVILSNSTSHSSGSTVQLICNVSGDPHQYQWQKDGGEISQPYQLTDGNRTLVIVKASRRDCGMYTCVATNPVSSIQTDCTLTILEKLVEAVILSNSTSHSSGSTVQLICNVSGDPHQYQWQKDGGEISQPYQLTDGNRTLVIVKASRRDCGMYTCVATNPVSSIQTDYTLTILEKLVEAVILSNSTSHSCGSTVQLICNVSGDPHQYQWQKDGGEISQPYQLTDGNRTLVIVKASRRDCGMYTCVATNPVSSIQTDYTLTILKKLVEAVILSNSTSHSCGSTVQLICNVSGDPHQYQWQKDGGEISQPYQLTDGNRTLVIVKASRRECGMYTCVATNPVSSIQTDYTLTILGFPPEDIAVITLSIIEPVISSVYLIVGVLQHYWKRESDKVLKNLDSWLLGLFISDVVFLVAIFITLICWIGIEGSNPFVVAASCTVPLQLLILFLPLPVSKPVCFQKYTGFWRWTLFGLHIVVFIISITFLTLTSNPNYQVCDSSFVTWRVFFATKFGSTVFFLFYLLHSLGTGLAFNIWRRYIQRNDRNQETRQDQCAELEALEDIMSDDQSLQLESAPHSASSDTYQ